MSWTLHQGSVETTLGPFTAVLSPDKPQLGLEILDGTGTLGHAFAVAVPTESSESPEYSFTVEEAYQRGSDFIVRFDQMKEDSFAFQLDWKLIAGSDSKYGFELWLSVQTDDLDSSPVLDIASDLKNTEWKQLSHQALVESSDEQDSAAAPAALFTSGGKETPSILWLIEPTDQRHIALQQAAGPSSRKIRLFDHFMEKGVIRRARMRCYLSADGFTEEEIRQLYEDLRNSPLPLTA